MAETPTLEQVFIGTLLVSGDFALPAALRAEMLSPLARRAFEAMRDLHQRGIGLDVPHVAVEADFTEPQRKWLEEAVQGASFEGPSAYAEKLVQAYERRLVLQAISQAEQALRDKRDLDTVRRELAAALYSSAVTDVRFREQAEAHAELVRGLEKGTHGKLLATGFPSVDRVVHIAPGQLVLLAARPGLGKSTLALNIAENVAMAGGVVAYHSLEMTEAELSHRSMARLTGIDAEAFTSGGRLKPDMLEQVRRAAQAHFEKAGKALLLNCRHHDLGAILALTERTHMRKRLALVVVDYVQLVEVETGGFTNDEVRIGTASRQLKLLASRLDVPVLAVAQLNREVERRESGGTRTSNFPKLSDLRGSGRLEQDANTVLFLHREGDGDMFQLVVAKQRAGRTGLVPLQGDLKHAQFKEPASIRIPPYQESRHA